MLLRGKLRSLAFEGSVDMRIPIVCSSTFLLSFVGQVGTLVSRECSSSSSFSLASKRALVTLEVSYCVRELRSVALMSCRIFYDKLGFCRYRGNT